MPILIEGYTLQEILELSEEQLELSIINAEPMVFRIGSAEILGQITLQAEKLQIELAQIDGGGEGVLPVIWILAQKYAEKHQLKQIEWIAHAITCAKPNPKLRQLLEKRGFVIRQIPDKGEAYYFLQQLS